MTRMTFLEMITLEKLSQVSVLIRIILPKEINSIRIVLTLTTIT